MSYWALTVINNLMTVLPLIGTDVLMSYTCNILTMCLCLLPVSLLSPCLVSGLTVYVYITYGVVFYYIHDELLVCVGVLSTRGLYVSM